MDANTNTLELLDERKVAAMTGLTRKRLQYMRSKNIGLPFVRLGGIVRYRPQDIARWLDEHTIVPGKAA